MYQKCPLCKAIGLFKKEICPVCLGERIINKEDGTPPSKHYIPYSAPYYPYSPYLYVPDYPWINPIIYSGGTNMSQTLVGEISLSTVTTKIYPSTFTSN